MKWENILKDKRKVSSDMKQLAASMAEEFLDSELDIMYEDDPKFKNLAAIKEIIHDDLVNLIYEYFDDLFLEMGHTWSDDIIQEAIDKNKDKIEAQDKGD
tara:strand:- start:305 stop:604 length:300 start_codon:yes stop_codon:yes gene_type:complete